MMNMKPSHSLLFSVALALSLAGCHRTEIKEKTVIEKPEVERHDVVIEKTVPALRDCIYSATTYSHGSLSCQAGYQYRCNDGTWDSSGRGC